MKNRIFLLLCITFFAITSFAQDQLSKSDYDRAVSYLWSNLNNKKVFNLYTNVNWFEDQSALWFIEYNSEGKTYQKTDLKKFQKDSLFDHQLLTEKLSNHTSKSLQASSLTLGGLKVKSDEEMHFNYEGKQFKYDALKNELELLEKEIEKSEFESESPDKKWTAYTDDYNLYIKAKDGSVKQLSFQGKKNFEYASYYGWYDIMLGENGERPERFWVNWSENSEWIYTSIVDLQHAEKMHLLDWSVDSLYRPQVKSYYRGSPGDTTMVYIHPVFFNIKTGEEVRIDLPKATHINQTEVRWSEEPGIVYLLEQKRGYQEFRLYRYDLNSKKLIQLYEEKSDTNIDNFEYRVYDEEGKILLLSERSGWRQIYQLDIASGKLDPVTNGDYYVNQLMRFENDEILFTASAVDANANPYHHQFYKIKLNGKGLKALTPELLHHQIKLSNDGKYFVDNMSSATEPTKTLLRSSKNGKVLAELTKADISQLDGWKAPKVFSTTSRDDVSEIYGALWLPTNFDPNKKYPIIDHSYTGPHTQMFPKDFRRVLSLGNQALAELGFIVMMVDGIGSSGRSKAFHDHSYKNLGGNLADHIVAIKYLGEKYEWIDTDKVGIFGHSAGGYDAAHALLKYPDFYKVAVSSSADHDHRMEKAWWPEMYMGWPVDSAYHKQSNITMADNLKGKLLITHGGIDDNVNPSATFKLAEALIRSDKQFDMVIMPSQGHGYRGHFSKYFTKLRWNYFVEHLLEKKPVWDFNWK